MPLPSPPQERQARKTCCLNTSFARMTFKKCRNFNLGHYYIGSLSPTVIFMKACRLSSCKTRLWKVYVRRKLHSSLFRSLVGYQKRRLQVSSKRTKLRFGTKPLSVSEWERTIHFGVTFEWWKSPYSTLFGTWPVYHFSDLYKTCR